MRADNDGHPESVNHCFAEFLDSRKEHIQQEWLQQVSPFLQPSDHSSNGSQISNRLSALLEDLTATLRHPCSTRAIEETTAGPCRDNDSLCYVLDEIKKLRENLLYHLRAFEDLHPDHGMAAMLFVSTVLHRFLDNLMIEAARGFGQADCTVPITRTVLAADPMAQIERELSDETAGHRDELMGMINHKLRNQLAGIAIHAKLLAVSNSNEGKRALECIECCVKSMDQLLEDLDEAGIDIRTPRPAGRE